MRACIDIYHQKVTIRNRAETEVMNLVYELETWDESDDELVIESDSDIGKDSDSVEYNALVLTLKDGQVPIAKDEEINAREEKVSHLSEDTQLISGGCSIVT